MVSKSQSNEVAPAINWADIDSIDAARAVLPVVVSATDVLGDGAEFITDKNVLVGSPFLVLDWHFIVDEKTEREYVNVLIMGANGKKARFNDGGTGVYAQLSQVSQSHGVVGIEVKGGLRRSDYLKEMPNGKKESATTYYLSA